MHLIFRHFLAVTLVAVCAVANAAPQVENAPAHAAAAIDPGRLAAFDAYVDAVRKQDGRATADIRFLAPSLPLPIETSPTLFADLVEGFLAEAGDAAAAGGEATVSLKAASGRLVATIRAADGEMIAGDAEARAAAEARRRLVESLALACGGRVAFAAAAGHVLDLPLRLAFPLA